MTAADRSMGHDPDPGPDDPGRAFATGPEAWREEAGRRRAAFERSRRPREDLQFHDADDMLDALARRLVCHADPCYPLLFCGWVNGKPQYRALSSSEDAPAELRRVLAEDMGS